MAPKVYRYQRESPLDLARLNEGLDSPASLVAFSAGLTADLQHEEAELVDLDENMALMGFTRIATDPATTPLHYGDNYQEVESLGESFSSTATLQEKLLLTTASLPLGDYQITTTMQVRATQASTQIQVVAELDASISLGIANLKAGIADSTVFMSPWGLLKAISGVHTVALQFAKPSGGGEAVISRVRIALWRVA